MNKKLLNLTIAFLVMFVGCKSKSEEPENNNAAFLESVKIEKVVLANRKEALMLTGKVENSRDQTINFIPLVSGTVGQVFFSLGDKVTKGQNLISLRSADLNELYSEQISAEAELRIAKREYQSAKALFEDKMLSERELFEAEANVAQAEAEVNRIKNTLSIYGADNQTGLFMIKSPMSGYILDKQMLSPGSNISAESDEPLFTISDLSSVWVIANVYPSDLRHVKIGMSAEITTLSYPGEVFHGKINAMSQIFDPEEKVLKARIVMPNKDLKLKPEMFVEVKLKNEVEQLYIAIPSDALIFDENKHFVVVCTSFETFENREVVVQSQHNNTSYIKLGLEENEEVVVKNQLLIYSGLKGK
ncbi:MAG: efflux RND transporter periplasmic adaptor subunit [Bacteroidales bacterium]|nr:efflux RND transporter periplasmic adaptor subunit [Bacteroidales bacterium]